MKISINGQKKDLGQVTSLREAVLLFCQNPKHVIAEVNGQIVKKEHWPTYRLKNNDSLELVNFVGGG